MFQHPDITSETGIVRSNLRSLRLHLRIKSVARSCNYATAHAYVPSTPRQIGIVISRERGSRLGKALIVELEVLVELVWTGERRYQTLEACVVGNRGSFCHLREGTAGVGVIG